MIKKIKAALKAAGVPEKYAAKVQALFNIESEENLDNYVALFKDNILPDIAANEDATTKAAEKAKADAIAAYEKEHGLKGGKAIKTEEKKEESPSEVQELKDQIKALTESVTTLTTHVTTSTKQTAVKAVYDKAGLPAKWLKRIDVDSETSVEDQIKELQEEYAEIRQGAVNEEVEAGNYTPHTHQVKDRSEKEWAELMNKESDSKESNGVASLGI